MTPAGSVALLGLDIAPETGPEYVFAGTTCNGSEPNLLLCPGGGEDEDILEDVTVECAGMHVTIHIGF